MKKLIALVLAGAMVFSMPVLASGSGTASATAAAASKSASSSSTTTTTPAPAPVPEVYFNGVPQSVVARAAAAEGKTIHEYVNNVVIDIPGLPDAMTVGQGGHVIINGAPSNQVFSVGKPNAATVASAKAQAAALGGKVMTVVNVDAYVRGFQTARVNFYTPGVVAGQNIQVYALVNGQWVALNVAEIRLDHVVVDMTGLGALLFVEL